MMTPPESPYLDRWDEEMAARLSDEFVKLALLGKTPGRGSLGESSWNLYIAEVLRRGLTLPADIMAKVARWQRRMAATPRPRCVVTRGRDGAITQAYNF